MQAGDHLADTGLGEPLRGNGMILLEPLQPALQVAKLLLGLLVLLGSLDHNAISTRPFRRPSRARVREKKATQPCQSNSSSAAKSSSGWRVNSMASSSTAPAS